jgi:hypothetical protein
MVRLLLRPAAAAEMQAISIAYLGQLRRDGLLKAGDPLPRDRPKWQIPVLCRGDRQFFCPPNRARRA